MSTHFSAIAVKSMDQKAWCFLPLKSMALLSSRNISTKKKVFFNDIPFQRHGQPFQRSRAQNGQGFSNKYLFLGQHWRLIDYHGNSIKPRLHGAIGEVTFIFIYVDTQ